MLRKLFGHRLEFAESNQGSLPFGSERSTQIRYLLQEQYEQTRQTAHLFWQRCGKRIYAKLVS